MGKVKSDDIADVAEATSNLLDALGDDRVISKLAKFARKLYLSLMNEGFTEEQALAIVSKQGAFGSKS